MATASQLYRSPVPAQLPKRGTPQSHPALQKYRALLAPLRPDPHADLVPRQSRDPTHWHAQMLAQQATYTGASALLLPSDRHHAAGLNLHLACQNLTVSGYQDGGHRHRSQRLNPSYQLKQSSPPKRLKTVTWQSCTSHNPTRLECWQATGQEFLRP